MFKSDRPRQTCVMYYALKTFVFFGLLVSLSSAAELTTFKITTGHLSSSTPSPVSSPLTTPPSDFTLNSAGQTFCAAIETSDNCTFDATSGMCEFVNNACVGMSTFCTLETCNTSNGAYCDGCENYIQEEEAV